MATPTFTSPTPTCIFLAAISAYSCVCQIGISNLLCPKLNSCSTPTNPASLMDFSISVNDHSILLALQAKIWNHSLSHTTHPGIQQSLLILPSKYILNPTTSPLLWISLLSFGQSHRRFSIKLSQYVSSLLCLSGSILAFILYYQRAARVTLECFICYGLSVYV